MNLTIFIITFNRPQFVNLILNYLIKRNFNCDVVIVDGSDKQHKKENLKIIRHFKSIYKNNIKYKFSEKQLKSICILARKVKTKYCLLVKMMANVVSFLGRVARLLPKSILMLLRRIAKK